MHQFSFQGSMTEVYFDRYGDDVGQSLVGSFSRIAKLFGKAMAGVERTAAVPAGMSDLSIDDDLLEQCVEWDDTFEKIYMDAGHRPGDWLTADEATDLLEMFRGEVDRQMRRACPGPHDSACMESFRALKGFYGLGHMSVDKMLLRARRQMDTQSDFMRRQYPPLGQ